VASRIGTAGAAPSSSVRHLTGRAQGEEQVFYSQVISTGEPKSFDFNGDLYCGGDPECWAGLLTFDPDNNVVADWAETWEVNADASKYTFHLRKDNKGWSDGTPVTAGDFVFSWARLLDLNTGNPYSFILLDIKYANEFQNQVAVDDANDPLNGKIPTAQDLGVKAIDDWTLEVTLVGPRAGFLQKVGYTACVPSPKWIVEGNPQWATGGVPLVSNGPMKLVEWDHNQKIVLAPNENYWDFESIKITKVVDPIYPAADNILYYEQGTGDQKLDWTQVSAGAYKRYQEDPNLASQLQPYVFPGSWFLLPQVTIAPFDKLDFAKPSATRSTATGSSQ